MTQRGKVRERDIGRNRDKKRSECLSERAKKKAKSNR